MRVEKTARRGVRMKVIVSAVLGVLFVISGLTARAQTGSLNVTLISEEDIGFDCPVTATLDRAGTTLWVLMNGCGERDYSLHTYDVNTQQRINDDDHNFSSALAVLEGSWSYGMSLAVLPDGAISIFYSDQDYQIQHLTIAAGADGSASTTAEVSADVGNLLAQYTDYPETTTYSVDHTTALVTGTDTVYVLDIQAQTELLAIEVPGSPDNAFVTSSPDGQRVYVAQFNNIDDMDDYRSTVAVYSLADGELLATYDVPSSFLWVSPDEQYAVATFGSSDGTSESIMVVDLDENRVSDALPVFEPPRHLTACANDGRDMSDVDFTVSGHLPARAVIWLPDMTGFFTLNSYGGEAAGGGRPCMFNYSRLRQYQVEG